MDYSKSGDEQVVKLSRETICILENSQDLIAFHEPKTGEYLKLSKSFCLSTGYTESELIGTNPYDYFHSDDVEIIKKSHESVLNKKPDTVTYRYRHKHGQYIWLETLSQIGGNYLITTSRNVTERHIMEKRNEELAKKMSFLMEKSTDHIVLFNKSGNIKDCSKSVSEDLGYQYEEMIGKNAKDFMLNGEDFKESLDSGCVNTMTKTGEELQMESENYEYNEDEIIVVARNVTLKNKMQEESLKLAELLKGILASATDMIFVHEIPPTDILEETIKSVITPQFPLVYISESVKNCMGYNLKTNVLEQIHEDDRHLINPQIKKLMNKQELPNIRNRLFSLVKRTYLHIEASFTVHDKYLVVVKRDLTERNVLVEIEKNLAVEKMERKKDLEAAQIFSHEAKNAFITSSHVASMLEEEINFVGKTENTNTIKTLLDELKTRANKGTALCMNETLWRSLLHDTYEVQKDEMKLGPWLEALAGSQAKLYMSEGLRAKYARLDRVLIETIINNAITNALKYGMQDTKPKIIVNESGRNINMTIRNKEGEQHKNLIDRIHTGWSTEELFDKNIRLAENTKNARNSSGHGLWVTRLAARALGGKVSFVVKRDCCDFVFCFPCEAHCNLGIVELPQLKIAILDDDRVERLTVEREFGSYDWVSELYVRGKTADECWQFPHFIVYNQIDVALFDENLFEEENGSDLMIEARKLGFKGVMISRSSMEALSGLTVVGKIADGFLPKCYRKEEEIRMRISDILQHSNEVKIANEVEAVSSLTSDGSKVDTVVFLDEVQDEFARKEPVVLTEMLQTLLRGEHYDTIKDVYIAAREELNVLLEKMVNISELNGKLMCSEKSERPYRYIHQMKGIAISIGFIKLQYFTQQMCNLKTGFRRETLNKVLPSVKLIIFESFAFVGGLLKTTI